MMIQLNLLPDIKKEVVKAQRMRVKVTLLAIIVSVICVGILALSAFWVYAVQPLRIKMARDDIAEQTKIIRQHKDSRKYLTLQNQLDKLPGLHEDKFKASRLMSFLPVLNPSDPNRIKLTTVMLSDTDSTITINGRTATFESQNVLTDTLANARLTYFNNRDMQKKITEPLFTSVKTKNSNLTRESGQQVVTFSITATYSENAFSNKVSNVSVSVPVIDDSKSVNQITSNLFEEAAE